jgi:hypothetical protein
MRYAFFYRNFFTKNERPKKRKEKKGEKKKESKRERERERAGGRESCYKFFENLCGIIQRIPAHSHSYLHAPP